MTALRRVPAGIRFAGFYLWSFLRANGLVLREVVTGSPGIAPAVVRVPAHGDRPWKVGAFAQLISLTPGTLTIDVSETHDVLYVHGLHVTSGDDLRRHLAELEARLLAVIG